jgi:hypothetical protein
MRIRVSATSAGKPVEKLPVSPRSSAWPEAEKSWVPMNLKPLIAEKSISESWKFWINSLSRVAEGSV